MSDKVPKNTDKLTMVEYFAGQALIGLLSSPNRNANLSNKAIAEEAVRIGELMAIEAEKVTYDNTETGLGV